MQPYLHNFVSRIGDFDWARFGGLKNRTGSLSRCGALRF